MRRAVRFFAADFCVNQPAAAAAAALGMKREWRPLGVLQQEDARARDPESSLEWAGGARTRIAATGDFARKGNIAPRRAAASESGAQSRLGGRPGELKKARGKGWRSSRRRRRQKEGAAELVPVGARRRAQQETVAAAAALIY